MPLELPDRATDCCTHHSHSHFLHQIVPHNPDTLPLAVLQFLGYPPRSCPTLQIMSPAITCLPFAHQVLCSSKASLYQASWLLAPAINGLVSSVSRTQRRLGWGQSLGDALSDLPGVTLWFGTRQGGPGSVCVCVGGVWIVDLRAAGRRTGPEPGGHTSLPFAAPQPAGERLLCPCWGHSARPSLTSNVA